jgi:hypothetical protein
MAFEPIYKKPGDPIRSEEWNEILNELVALKKYIESMTRSVTLTGLESPTGSSCRLSTDAPENFNYGMDVMGLITRQYYVPNKETGEVCTFGIHDFADLIYYWAGASKSEAETLEITLEYVDGTTFTSEKLFIDEWSQLRIRSDKNPYLEYIQTTKGVWYRYGFRNPKSGREPENEIRYITFKEARANSGIKIGNVIQYDTRVYPLQNLPGMK